MLSTCPNKLSNSTIEASMRTSCSLAAAMKRLGGKVLSSDETSSSHKKVVSCKAFRVYPDIVDPAGRKSGGQHLRAGGVQ